MKKQGGQLLYAATDLADHLGCSHLTELERAVAEGRLTLECHTDPTLDLRAELGQAHEQAYLEFLRAQGKTIVQIKEFGGAASVQQTLDAMRRGVDVIQQINNDGSAALHAASLFCHAEIVKALLNKGADKSVKNNAGFTALELVSTPFDSMEGTYDFLGTVLKPLGLELDYERIEATRPQIASM